MNANFVLKIGIVFCLALTQKVQAQGYAAQMTIENIIEELSNLEDADLNLELLHETLSLYAQYPLNLNTASAEELSQLKLLSDFQIYSLREYLATYGEMLTPYELQYVHGFTQELMVKLLPFVCTLPSEAQENPTLKNMLTHGRHELLLRGKQTVEQQQGYAPISDEVLREKPNSRYVGSPQALYGRYKYHYRDRLQWGLVADKDAGEEFFAGSNRAGFDFYAAHLQVSHVGIVQKLVIGDYYAQFGQGLALRQGGLFGKSSDAASIGKRGAGINAYLSADENNFFRGVATTLRIKKLDVSVFFSYKKRDADMDSSGGFSTLHTTGYHNTQKTLQDKDALQEMATGMNVSRRFKKVYWGATCVWHRMEGDYNKKVAPYNMFELNQNSNFNVSSDFRWYIKKFYVFGEAGMSQNTAMATLVGVAVDVASPLQLSLLYRNYAKDYQAQYANAFSEGGKTANEKGVYFGATVFPHKKFKTSFYIDAFQFPWLRYKANSPSQGFDALLQVDYSPAHDCQMYWRAKYDTKEENVPNENYPLKTTDEVEKISLRYNIAYKLLEGLSCQSRVEASFYKAGSAERESGLLAFQDVKYSFARPQLSFSVRYALANTDSYNTRLYAYENDVLYAFSVPAYYGNSSRWYFNLHYRPHEKIEFWFRIAQTHYFDRTQLGSGLTLINAPQQTEVKLQAKIRI